MALVAGAALGVAAGIAVAVRPRSSSPASSVTVTASTLATTPVAAPPVAAAPSATVPAFVASAADTRAAIERALGEVAARDHAAIDATRPRIPARFRAETRVALAVLLRAAGFATGGEGVDGVFGFPTILAAHLAGAPDGVDAATWLAAQAPLPGQLYAYWMLRELAPDREPALRARLVADRREVTSREGCVWSDRPLAAFVAGLDRTGRTAATVQPSPDQVTYLADALHDILARPVPAPTTRPRRR